MTTVTKVRKNQGLFHRNKAKYGNALRLIKFLELVNPGVSFHFTKAEMELMHRSYFCIEKLEVERGHKMFEKDFKKVRSNLRLCKREFCFPYGDHTITYEELIELFNYCLFLESGKHTEERKQELTTYLGVLRDDKIELKEFLMHMNLLLLIVSLLISSPFEKYYSFDMRVYCKTARKLEKGVVIKAGVCHASKRFFKGDGVNRAAFRLCSFQVFKLENVKFDLSEATGKSKYKDVPVFIQKHAGDRLKQRLNLDPTENEISYYLAYIMFGSQEIIQIEDSIYIALIADNYKLGYFVGHIVEDCLLIRTFLFITQIQTPEGRQFCELAKLSARDISYWKIDCLETLQSVDEDLFPHICELLEQAGIGDVYNYRKAIQNGKKDFKYNLFQLQQYITGG